MDKSVAIRVENVKKDFKVYFDKGSSFKEKILFRERNRYERREVLKGVSFDVKKGEAIGLIGKNGCGKSTMLKMLTKIMYPTSGSVTTQGRISALIELGAGFHPDMSGRENIYTNAAIFGLSRKEIDDRLQTIIDFSELGSYIDNPVRTYSSGMYMRLAFAVAINVDADILLIDEILAVGDAAFQAKCFNKLREIKAKGTTIVIVSHSLGQIEQICDRCIWINDGQIFACDEPRGVIPMYLDYMGTEGKKIAQEEQIKDHNELNRKEPPETIKTEMDDSKEAHSSDNRWGNKAIEIERIVLLDKSMKEQTSFKCGAPLYVEMTYIQNESASLPVFGIGIFRNDGLHCYGTNTLIERCSKVLLNRNGKVICQLLRCNLLPGDYSMDVAVHAEDGTAYDYWCKACKFSVYSDIQDIGVMRIETQWSFK